MQVRLRWMPRVEWMDEHTFRVVCDLASLPAEKLRFLDFKYRWSRPLRGHEGVNILDYVVQEGVVLS
jgi:hypothetical protein